jgi:hypothetical protein
MNTGAYFGATCSPPLFWVRLPAALGSVIANGQSVHHFDFVSSMPIVDGNVDRDTSD